MRLPLPTVCKAFWGCLIALTLVSNISAAEGTKPKVYWFVPDGLRAEDEQFTIYKWAQSGELPNLQRLLREGSYGYSWPVFPGHTPTNFATLMTGTTPDIHGIADGAMRMVGYPLNTVARGGFSSLAKLVRPIWLDAEQSKYLVSLLSVPGSTPPQLVKGNTINGRWGGWGPDFPAINFHTRNDRSLMLEIGQNRRLFTFGSDLTRFLSASSPKNWSLKIPTSYSPPRELTLTNWGETIYALLYDSTDDHQENYDHVLFSKDRKHVLADVKLGAWSTWLPVTLQWKLGEPVPVSTELKLKVLRLGKRDQFRIRFLYNNLHQYSTSPPEVADAMNKALGPMVDFVDNYPPQLIYFPEDKNTFLEEARFSLEWHRKAVPFLMRSLKSDFVIHSIYTPNQMLTSRWWMPYLDKNSPKYHDVSEEARAQLWREMKEMYKGIDAILGEILKSADDNTYIFFSSDHGALPLYKEVRLNNLFAAKGWLKYRFDAKSAEFRVDWNKTRVIFLQMDNIYINSRGLGGIYQREHGAAYEKLRDEVVQELKNLKNEKTGEKVLAQSWKWEDAKLVNLPQDRVGDLIVANSAGYNWVEDISKDGIVLHDTLKGGYKQAVLPKNNKAMLTPFVAWGPGIKAGHQMREPINHVDQYRTIMHVLGIPAPKHATGKVLEDILRK